jgi:hypothetical protein
MTAPVEWTPTERGCMAFVAGRRLIVGEAVKHGGAYTWEVCLSGDPVGGRARSLEEARRIVVAVSAMVSDDG